MTNKYNARRERRRWLLAVTTSLGLHLLWLRPLQRAAAPVAAPAPGLQLHLVPPPVADAETRAPPVSETPARQPLPRSERAASAIHGNGKTHAEHPGHGEHRADRLPQAAPPPDILLAAYRLALYRALPERCRQLGHYAGEWRGLASVELAITEPGQCTASADRHLPPALAAELEQLTRAASIVAPPPPALRQAGLRLALGYLIQARVNPQNTEKGGAIGD